MIPADNLNLSMNITSRALFSTISMGEKLFVTITLVFLAIFIIIADIFIIYILSKLKNLANRRFYTLVIVHCVVKILTCLSAMFLTLTLALLYFWPVFVLNYIWCKLLFTPLIYFETVYILSMSWIAYDRFFAIFRPLQYREGLHQSLHFRLILLFLFPFVTFSLPSLIFEKFTLFPKPVACFMMGSANSEVYMEYLYTYWLFFTMTNLILYISALIITKNRMKKISTLPTSEYQQFVGLQIKLTQTSMWIIFGCVFIQLFYKIIQLVVNFQVFPLSVNLRLEKYTSLLSLFYKIYDSGVWILRSDETRRFMFKK